MNPLDLTGKKYNKLTAIKYCYSKNGKRYWECYCDCGNIVYVLGTQLKSGKIKSCGCIKYGNKFNCKHNKKGTRIYTVWNGIKQRCYNKNSKSYKNYGGQGVSMCDEWKNDFMSFYNWAMTNGYRDDLTIDRIDVNGNYEPNNCRWVNMKTQQNNRKNNDYIEYKGEKHTLQEWTKILSINISQPVLWQRIHKYNWSIEKAFLTPVNRRKNRWKNGKTRN